VVEGMIGGSEPSMINGEEVFLRGFGKFHHQVQSRESGPKYFQKHVDCDSRPQYSGIQASQESSGEDEVNFISNECRKSTHHSSQTPP